MQNWHSLIDLILLKNINQLIEGLKMTKFETAIIKRIDIFLKMFSNFLVIKTIESKTVKTLTDKQLETITPVATDKLKTINKNIYS